ncbi:sugar phosphate isomerase/epimerase family protein [Clostridium lundense]|uniref:sugar phosphate isomerase/epimerase family protein n=1 Tax=Clostridium lundense TaxID=319475 RepID=UPI0004864AB0|nr:TIM barrel protein [Clostridium lundense]
MKVGVSSPYKKLHLISETFKEYNIEHIQISLPADLKIIENDLYNEIIKYKTKNPSIEISIHAYPFNLAEKVQAVRNIWIELAEKTISFANKIEASFVNFHIGYSCNSGKRTEHHKIIKKLIPVLYKITEVGIHNNVEIHIENSYPEQRNSDFSKMGDRLSDFEKIFEVIDSSALKLCYDYGHGNLDEHGIDILRKFHFRLGSIHAHDNDQLADIHWPIGNKKLGTINWNKEIKFLMDINFQGAFILESYIKDQLESLNYLKKLK